MTRKPFPDCGEVSILAGHGEGSAASSPASLAKMEGIMLRPKVVLYKTFSVVCCAAAAFVPALSSSISILLIVLLSGLECGAQTGAQGTNSTTLPANTPVKLSLKNTVAGKSLQPGNTVEFELVESVVVNGEVAIPMGTSVNGTIRKIESQGGGRATLLVEAEPAETVTGQTVRLADVKITGFKRTAGKNDDDSAFTLKGVGDVMVAGGLEVTPLIPAMLPIALFRSLIPKKHTLLYYESTRAIANVTDAVALDPAKLGAAQANITKAGYAVVFFARTNMADNVVCGQYLLNYGLDVPDAAFAVRLPPGHYQCRVGKYNSAKSDRTFGDIARFDFQDGREYYVAVRGSVLDGNGTVDDWNQHVHNDYVRHPGDHYLFPFKTVEEYPNSEGAHHEMGEYFRAAGHFDEAIAEYQKALALNHDYAEAQLRLAEAFEDKGDFARAAPEYRRAVQLKPEDRAVRSQFMRFLEKSGDRDGAIAEAKDEVRIWPGDKSLQKELSRLQQQPKK
jgi:TPR repeat